MHNTGLMPKNPLKSFGRRRSSGNALDVAPETTPPAQSSFRVLERPRDNGPAYGKQNSRVQGKPTVIRPFNSPLHQLRGKSADDLQELGANRCVGGDVQDARLSALRSNRGSGGTTNSGSSGYYESSAASARHSSSSTLPSSLEQDREPEHEELYPREPATTPMYHSASADADAPLQPPSTFTSRAARALSFGNKHYRQPSYSKALPAVPPIPLDGPPRSPERSHSPQRERAMTTSSYASTAVPTKHEPSLTLGNGNLGVDFGDDGFGDMFGNIGRSAQPSQEHLPTPPPPSVGGTFHRTVREISLLEKRCADTNQDSEPIFPPKSYSRQALTPSPSAFRMARDDAGSPYSADGRNSNDGLFSSSTFSSPKLEDGPPVPAHGKGIASAFLGASKGSYALVPPERSYSPLHERSSQDSQTGFGAERDTEQDSRNKRNGAEDDDRWIKRVELHDGPALSETASNQSFRTGGSVATARKPVAPGQASAGASRLGATSPGSDEASVWASESKSSTPKAANRAINTFSDESLFDSSPLGPASRAVRPGHTRTESGTPKKMTKAQFDILQRYGDSSQEHSADEAHEDDEYEDEDDIERAKQATRQRRKQEANIAVYRQQMKKVTGGGPSDLPNSVRPSLDRAANSAPAAAMGGLHLGGVGGTPPADAIRGTVTDDDDEDVPLGILQAHGFPGAGRPPTRMAENDTQRRTSVAGSVMGGGGGQGNLPPFARRLPADPYFGSSLVNPASRESLPYNGAGSVYGGAPAAASQGHPAGLVGVIAGEERARAARRGSPNPMTGTYGAAAMPLPANMPPQMQGMPGLPRTMSMGSVVSPQTYLPSGLGSMPMMPMMPGMPPMPMMSPSVDYTQQQMQQFMQMQMQFMQNMMAMQQQQLTSSPQPQTPTGDYLGIPMPDQRRMSMASQAPSFQNGMLPGQGRAMTMMNPPTRWDFANGPQRPTSAMPNGYAPSVHGMNGGAGGPGPGYTPSIAPSERSNVGMPSRYRPVTMNGTSPSEVGGRSQSMTSSMTLQAFQPPPESKSTIRVVDKPKGAPKANARPVAVDEDEDDGWAEMARKKAEKKFSWRKGRSEPQLPLSHPSLSDLYKDYE